MATTNPTLKEIGEERQKRLAEERAARGEDDEETPMVQPDDGEGEPQKKEEEKELTPSEYMRRAINQQKEMNEIRQRRLNNQENNEEVLNPDDVGEMTIEEMNRRQYGLITYFTCTYFWIYALICSVIIVIAQVCKSRDPCGIDVILWV